MTHLPIVDSSDGRPHCRITPADLGRPLIRQILKEIDLTPERYTELLGEL